MPPFWRSLLSGSSSTSSAAGAASSSRTDGSSTPVSPSNKSSAGAASAPVPRTASGDASSNGSSASPHKHRQPHPTSPSPAKQQSTSPSAPIGIPGQPTPPPASSTSSHHASNLTGAAEIPFASSTSRQQHSTSVNSTSGLSGTSSASYGETANGDDPDDSSSVPAAPYSTGHSPSHARHKFPVATGDTSNSQAGDRAAHGSKNRTRTAHADTEEVDARLSDEDAPPTGPASSNGTDSRETAEQSSSGITVASSTVSSPSSPSSPLGGNARQSPFKPDIPTTHTILANPLPQPSSGLAAAISSVLPSSASSSNISPPAVSSTNGTKATPAGSAGPDTSGPRTFDIDDMITRLLDAGYSGKISKSVSLKNSEITALCLAAREVFLSQPTLLELSPPVNIVGDVHGQYSDLLRLFEMCSFPPRANYLFLGDYVDRGKQSLETILLLLCYKVKYPENFFLLRGNHECANVTRVYGFYDECKRRCNLKIWKTFVDVFNCLPIAALVAGKIFCVHGGLSPSLSSMDDIRRISRPTDVPDYGLLNDLLWSDPSDTALDWEDNERGVSYCFGKAVIQEFLAKYDFDLICRAHMVVEDGYEFWNDRTLVTIFSAPNYCGEFDNFASSMLVNEDLLCSFELLKPLDGAALKKELAKCRKKNSAGLLLPRSSV